MPGKKNRIFFSTISNTMTKKIFSYHVCPLKSNFQFDTSFMFIIAVLTSVKLYQNRHAEINPQSATTFFFLAPVILFTVIGVVRNNKKMTKNKTFKSLILFLIFSILIRHYFGLSMVYFMVSSSLP